MKTDKREIAIYLRVSDGGHSDGTRGIGGQEQRAEIARYLATQGICVEPGMRALEQPGGEDDEE